MIMMMMMMMMMMVIIRIIIEKQQQKKYQVVKEKDADGTEYIVNHTFSGIIWKLDMCSNKYRVDFVSIHSLFFVAVEVKA